MNIVKKSNKIFKKEQKELRKEFLNSLKNNLPNDFFIKGSRIELQFIEMRSGDVLVKTFLIKSSTHCPKLIYKKYIRLGTLKINYLFSLYQNILKREKIIYNTKVDEGIYSFNDTI